MKTITTSKIVNYFFSFFTTVIFVCICLPNLVAQTGPNYAGSVINDGSSGTVAWISPSSASGSADDVMRAETPTWVLMRSLNS